MVLEIFVPDTPLANNTHIPAIHFAKATITRCDLSPRFFVSIHVIVRI